MLYMRCAHLSTHQPRQRPVCVPAAGRPAPPVNTKGPILTVWNASMKRQTQVALWADLDVDKNHDLILNTILREVEKGWGWEGMGPVVAFTTDLPCSPLTFMSHPQCLHTFHTVILRRISYVIHKNNYILNIVVTWSYRLHICYMIWGSWLKSINSIVYKSDLKPSHVLKRWALQNQHSFKQ